MLPAAVPYVLIIGEQDEKDIPVAACSYNSAIHVMAGLHW
jgi:hypothetical protein